MWCEVDGPVRCVRSENAGRSGYLLAGYAPWDEDVTNLIIVGRGQSAPLLSMCLIMVNSCCRTPSR